MQCNWWGRASLGTVANLFSTVLQPWQLVPVKIVSLHILAKAHLCQHCHIQPLGEQSASIRHSSCQSD